MNQGNIRNIVFIKIPTYHNSGIDVLRCTDNNRIIKSAVTVSKKHRKRVNIAVRSRQIRIAVTIKIAGNNEPRLRPHCITYEILEISVAISQEHGDIVA